GRAGVGGPAVVGSGDRGRRRLGGSARERVEVRVVRATGGRGDRAARKRPVRAGTAERAELARRRAGPGVADRVRDLEGALARDLDLGRTGWSGASVPDRRSGARVGGASGG